MAIFFEDALDIKFPLVSVVITNFNYARFLPEAVGSVISQTYPHIETIVIDDCSTDESATVIEELRNKNPNLIVHYNAKNSGQGQSCRNGYQLSRGAYVIFLDADDYLLETCIETHVLAHLSLRMPVGFTSVDMIQISEGRMVTTTSQGFSEYVLSGKGMGLPLHRSGVVNDSSCTESIKEKLHFVHPLDARFWPWSPTSGNCFRRDALEIIVRNDRLTEVRSCADIYFLRGVAALSGSVLIDQPLAVYRLHGKNDFLKGATLYRMRIFDVRYLEQHSYVAMTVLIDYLFDQIESVFARIESPHYLIEALDVLDDCWPPIQPGTWGSSYLLAKIVDRKEILTRLFGRDAVLDWQIAQLMPKHWRRGQLQPLRMVGRLCAALPARALVEFVSRRKRVASPRTRGFSVSS